MKNLNDDQIYDIIKQYVEAYGNNYSWGYGDSLDRERVRDIILEQPQFTFNTNNNGGKF